MAQCVVRLISGIAMAISSIHIDMFNKLISGCRFELNGSGIAEDLPKKLGLPWALAAPHADPLATNG